MNHLTIYTRVCILLRNHTFVAVPLAENIKQVLLCLEVAIRGVL